MSPDVVVLNDKIHGMNPADYADALRERLPERTIRFARTPEAERAGLRTATVATGKSIDPEAVAEAENLRLFACSFAGTDHLPLDDLAAHDVAVTNAAGVHGPNAAEHAVGAVLSFARGFHVARRRQARREWRSYQTREVADSTVTVVGLGHIGTAIAERLRALDATVLGVRHTPEKDGPVEETYGFDEAHEAFARSEFVVLAAPLTDETRHLVDGAALRTLPPSAVLVNVGRGGLVDTDALVAALRSNAIDGAALDVTDPEPLPEDHPLWGFENVLVTPHNAGHTPRYWDRLADVLVENLEKLDASAGAPDSLRNQVAP